MLTCQTGVRCEEKYISTQVFDLFLQSASDCLSKSFQVAIPPLRMFRWHDMPKAVRAAVITHLVASGAPPIQPRGPALWTPRPTLPEQVFRLDNGASETKIEFIYAVSQLSRLTYTELAQALQRSLLVALIALKCPGD
jgi:hypothetical protein